ncbi:MAG: hypothetical protein HY460_03135 [Parcubacteria group bacterium]|nr:hypothetical protein [Parcubacteria group bacterium]
MNEPVRQSQLFFRTLRASPRDEEAMNAKLLIRAGYIEKLMAGVYTYLPLGLRVLRNIEAIVREEMNAIGAKELLMPMLHPKSLWERTGAWRSVDVLFTLKSRTGKEYALGQSEEEVVTPLVLNRVHTYRDLPVHVYQIHWKFRDELRAKSGLLRGREFYMKDLYSFHETQEDFDRYYEKVKEAYVAIFRRLGLVAKATEASGGSFSEKISYEFMVLTEAGEDEILFCNECEFCINAHIAKQKERDRCPKCSSGSLARAKASEVGNVFDLGQKYGRDFKLSFIGRDGNQQYPVMGCYGIGISRLMGVIVEKYHDENGILWPAAIAPFQVHVLMLGAKGTENRDTVAEEVCAESMRANIAVLYDDRPLSPGEKFADADLIGIPWRILVGKLAEKQQIEIKKRSDEKSLILPVQEFASWARNTVRA